MKTLEVTAKTVDEAIANGIKELGVSRDKVEIEILDKGTRGIFGFGAKPASVKLTAKNDYIGSAKKFLEDILNQMGVESKIDIVEEGSVIKINLSGPNMGILIGYRGETLDSIQYLVSLVINKESKEEEYKRVILDTENYRKKREETLIRLANKLAYKVKKYNRSVSLEPMNPYERRVIHAALQDNQYVTTHSEGEEPYRKVVICLKK